MKKMMSERLRAHPSGRSEKLIGSATEGQVKIDGNILMIFLSLGNYVLSTTVSSARGM
jgi:hypothetical protein